MVQFCLDQPLPARLKLRNCNRYIVEGWLCGPVETRAIAVKVGERQFHATELNRLRPDVCDSLRAVDPHAYGLFSGFRVSIPLDPVAAPVALPVRLQAQFRNGWAWEQPLPSLTIEPWQRPEPRITLPRCVSPQDLVVICMATYRPQREAFRRQVQSLIDQQHRNWICIVSDDGSQESERRMIREILARDPRFLLVEQAQNVGFYHNFERCLELVPPEAKYVALCDQDDHWYPEKLSTCLERFEGPTQLVYSDMRLVRPNGQVLAETYWGRRKNYYETHQLDLLTIANTVTGAASMFRAELLEKALPFPVRNGQVFHDQWLAILAAATGGIAYVPRPLYDYVQHGANVIGHSDFGPAGVLPLMRHLWRSGGDSASEGFLSRYRPQRLARSLVRLSCNLCRFNYDAAKHVFSYIDAASTRDLDPRALELITRPTRVSGLLKMHAKVWWNRETLNGMELRLLASHLMQKLVRRCRPPLRGLARLRGRRLERLAAAAPPAASPASAPAPALMPALSPAQARDWHRRLTRRPRISIVVPVYRIAPRWLECCIESVRAQYYQNWELVLVDDHSQRPELTRLMQRHARRDRRIKVITHKANGGISRATNTGIQAALGEFIGLLDHDDELTPDALTWVVAAHNRHPDALWFYSDETTVDEDGTRLQPILKPAYSPEFLLSCMYCCHFSVYSTALLRKVGGARVGLEGAQDHDLALRLSETVRRDEVVHIPRLLYHWRAIPGSTANDNDAKPYATTAGSRAVAEALARRGLKGDVELSPHVSTNYRVRLQPRRSSSVTILIPTRNALEDVKTCLASVHRHAHYANYEVVVIDNQSDDPDLLRFLDREQRQGSLRVVRYPHPFNHSAMHNQVVRECQSDYLVFMNNDVEILTDGWLPTMVATAELDPAIAGVGALLQYPDETVQHAGMVLGFGGLAGHAHRGMHVNDPGYYNRLQLMHETYGATAALLLMSRPAFLAVGGFDAENFPTSFNDVDLWIRLQQAGYRCLYNPLVRAIHYESKTRKTDQRERLYEQTLAQRWQSVLYSDPFYNPNLPLGNESFIGLREFPIRDFEDGDDQFRRVGTVRPNVAESAPEVVLKFPAAERPGPDQKKSGRNAA